MRTRSGRRGLGFGAQGRRHTGAVQMRIWRRDGSLTSVFCVGHRLEQSERKIQEPFFF